MTVIYWSPVDGQIDPDTIAVYDDNGDKIGDIDMSDVNGMPDSIGGVAPDAVRELVQTQTNKTAYEADHRTSYKRGQPNS